MLIFSLKLKKYVVYNRKNLKKSLKICDICKSVVCNECFVK